MHVLVILCFNKEYKALREFMFYILVCGKLARNLVQSRIKKRKSEYLQLDKP